MTAEIGIVLSVEYDILLDSDEISILLLCEVSGESDIQTVELYSPGNLYHTPQEGDRVLIISVTDEWKIAVGFDSVAGSDLQGYLEGNPGNTILFSQCDEVIQSTFELKNDNSIKATADTFVVSSSDINLTSDSPTDFVSLDSKVKAQLSALLNAIATAPVGTADGGALFKASITGSLAALGWPGDTGSEKIKAD